MKVPILRILCALVKICQIPHVIFQTTSQFFLNFAWLFSVMKYNCAVLGQTLYTLHKRDQSKSKFLDFLVPKSTFTKFLSFLKQKISFSSNFAQLFGIMRHIPSILFLDETLYAFSKSSLSQYKLGEISTDQSKLWNFALWWAPFVNIKFQLKEYRGVIFHFAFKVKESQLIQQIHVLF